MRRGLIAGVLALAIVPAAFAAPPLDFDRTFSTAGEPARLHYRAHYVLQGQAHEVEVWREGARRLRRRTDQRIETFVEKVHPDAEFHMVVLDLDRKIRTDLDRTDLARIGHLIDWFGLANSLVRPSGAYRLSEIGSAGIAERPVAECRWYLLTQAVASNRVCWSERDRVPLLITDAAGKLQWKVTALESGPLLQSVFEIVDQGFVRNDAHQDIQGD